MKRKPGTLLPIERSILAAAARRDRAAPAFHGFAIAKELEEHPRARLLTGYGTLYRALERLEAAGLLESEWEDPAVAAEAGRPRRRLYRIVDAGVSALARAADEPTKRLDMRPAGLMS